MCIPAAVPRVHQIERNERPIPVAPPPGRTIERRPEDTGIQPPDGPGPIASAPPLAPPPLITTSATPPTVSGPSTAAELSAANVARAAPQSLGGLASRFATPVGKQGYSKSLRPEAGRLVR